MKKKYIIVILIIVLIVLGTLVSSLFNKVNPNNNSFKNGIHVINGEFWTARNNSLISYDAVTKKEFKRIYLPNYIQNPFIINTNNQTILSRDNDNGVFLVTNIESEKTVKLSDNIVSANLLPDNNLVLQEDMGSAGYIGTSTATGSGYERLVKLSDISTVIFLPLSPTEVFFYHDPLDVSNVNLYKLNLKTKSVTVAFPSLGNNMKLNPDGKTLYYNFITDNSEMHTGIINLADNKKHILPQSANINISTWTKDNQLISVVDTGEQKNQVVIVTINGTKLLSNESYDNITGLALQDNATLLVTTNKNIFKLKI